MDFKVPFLSNTEIQRQIVTEFNIQMQTLEGLRKMEAEAEKKIGKLLADVWGVEFIEAVTMEVEDEQED